MEVSACAAYRGERQRDDKRRSPFAPPLSIDQPRRRMTARGNMALCHTRRLTYRQSITGCRKGAERAEIHLHYDH
jgi:hypothetical protein